MRDLSVRRVGPTQPIRWTAGSRFEPGLASHAIEIHERPRSASRGVLLVQTLRERDPVASQRMHADLGPLTGGEIAPRPHALAKEAIAHERD